MTTQPIDATTNTWKRRQDVPLAFRLHHNRRKLKSANPKIRQEYQEWQDFDCVLFVSGKVILDRDYVNYFPSMTAFKDHFEELGDYEIQWVSEMSQE